MTGLPALHPFGPIPPASAPRRELDAEGRAVYHGKHGMVWRDGDVLADPATRALVEAWHASSAKHRIGLNQLTEKQLQKEAERVIRRQRVRR